MISPDVPFRRNLIAFQQAFPEFGETIVAVIEGATPERVERAEPTSPRRCARPTTSPPSTTRGRAVLRSNWPALSPAGRARRPQRSPGCGPAAAGRAGRGSEPARARGLRRTRARHGGKARPHPRAGPGARRHGGGGRGAARRPTRRAVLARGPERPRGRGADPCRWYRGAELRLRLDGARRPTRSPPRGRSRRPGHRCRAMVCVSASPAGRCSTPRSCESGAPAPLAGCFLDHPPPSRRC